MQAIPGDPRMKLLVIGTDVRAHALEWKLAQSSRVDEVLVAPGNAGTATEDKCRNADVPATDIDGLLALERDEGVALTVVGTDTRKGVGKGKGGADRVVLGGRTR